MKIDLLYFSRAGVEKLWRYVEWAAKFFVCAPSGLRKIFQENSVFLRAPPVINNDRSLSESKIFNIEFELMVLQRHICRMVLNASAWSYNTVVCYTSKVSTVEPLVRPDSVSLTHMLSLTSSQKPALAPGR